MNQPANQQIQAKNLLYSQLSTLVQKDKQPNSSKQRQNMLKSLPQSFWKFMSQRDINIQQVLIQVPRFIRLKPQLNLIETSQLEQLTLDLNINKSQIVQVGDGCFALAPSCKINHSKMYQEGIMYGMDVSSIMAVKCLDIKQNSNMLELCAAPGNKSMYACDIEPTLKITAIQINQNRANVMKNLIKKYRLDDRITIIVEDATKYQSKQLYDRVLVDAQCTHQGSVKHLKKFTKSQGVNTKKQKKLIKSIQKQQQKQFCLNKNPYASLFNQKNEWTFSDFQQRFLDPIKLQNLKQLQTNLIKNGFKQLKQNGVLVYSTCSIDKSQNQQIVQQLLNQFQQQVELIDVTQSLGNCRLKFRRGHIKQTAYFTPKLSMCGGMFICKILKRKK